MCMHTDEDILNGSLLSLQHEVRCKLQGLGLGLGNDCTERAELLYKLEAQSELGNLCFLKV